MYMALMHCNIIEWLFCRLFYFQCSINYTKQKCGKLNVYIEFSQRCKAWREHVRRVKWVFHHITVNNPVLLTCALQHTIKKIKTSRSSLPLLHHQETSETVENCTTPQNFCIFTKFLELHREECAKDNCETRTVSSSPSRNLVT